MAREMKISGMEELSRMLEKLGTQAGAVAAQALYKGAGIVADAVRQSAESLDTEPFRFAGENRPRKASPEEKDVLVQYAAGIARFERSGAEVSTSVGLKDAGYADIAGKTIPVPVIARSINSGTTFRVKQPFFRLAVNKARGKASAAIASEVEKTLNEILR